MKPAFIVAFGERITSPSAVNTHDRPNANRITSADRSEHARHAAVRPVSDREPQQDDHGAGHEVAHAVAEQRPEQRRGFQIGSERKRSITPFVRSVLIAMPE